MIIDFNKKKSEIEFSKTMDTYEQMIYEMQTVILPGENVTLWEKFAEYEKRDNEINKEFLDTMPDFINAKFEYSLKYLLHCVHQFYEETDKYSKIQLFLDKVSFAYNYTFQVYNEYCDVNNHIKPTRDIEMLESKDEYTFKNELISSITDTLLCFPDNTDEKKIKILDGWMAIDTYESSLRLYIADVILDM